MRTTINLPDDVYKAAKAMADFEGISLGNAIAVLARRGLNERPAIDTSKPFPCFVPEPGAEPLTLERALELEHETEEEI